jgi:hypothetical protein
MAEEQQAWPRVAISILNWNGWCDTLECLESVRRLDYPNYLTIVVDNNSWNDSVERIRDWAQQTLPDQGALVEYTRETALRGGDPNSEAQLDGAESPNRLVLIHNEENLGFSGGNNVAIHYALHRGAPSDYVFLLNNDALVTPECLSLLIATQQKAGAGIAGPIVYSKDGHAVQAAGGDSWVRLFFYPIVGWKRPIPHNASLRYSTTILVTGTAQLIRRDVLLAVRRNGGEYLRVDLFMYGEDFVMCFEAQKAGFRSIYAERCAVYHKSAASSGGRGNPLAHYYNQRNRVFVANQILRGPWKALFHVVNVPLALARAFKNLAGLRPASALAIACALVDSYRGLSGKWKYHDSAALGLLFWKHRAPEGSTEKVRYKQ